MVCPQQRLEDFTSQLEVSTAAQAQALEDELQSWYFGVGATFKIEASGSSASSGGQKAGLGQQVDRSMRGVDARNRPPVDVLEQAAAGVKAQLTAGGAFQPPPPMPASLRDGSSSGQAAAGGGGRGVAAARANRGGALGPPMDC